MLKEGVSVKDFQNPFDILLPLQNYYFKIGL